MKVFFKSYFKQFYTLIKIYDKYGLIDNVWIYYTI